MAVTTANVTTTDTTVYTSSGNSAVTFATLTNYSASSVTVDVHVVPDGGAAGNLNLIIANLSITAEDTHQLYASGEKLLLEDGDTIVVSCSADNAVASVTSYTAI